MAKMQYQGSAKKQAFCTAAHNELRPSYHFCNSFPNPFPYLDQPKVSSPHRCRLDIVSLNLSYADTPVKQTSDRIHKKIDAAAHTTL